MKHSSKLKFTAFISIVLCFSVVFSSIASAQANLSVDSIADNSYTETEQFVGETSPQSKGDTLKVRAPFIIAPIFSEASIFSSIIG